MCKFFFSVCVRLKRFDTHSCASFFHFWNGIETYVIYLNIPTALYHLFESCVLFFLCVYNVYHKMINARGFLQCEHLSFCMISRSNISVYIPDANIKIYLKKQKYCALHVCMYVSWNLILRKSSFLLVCVVLHISIASLSFRITLLSSSLTYLFCDTSYFHDILIWPLKKLIAMIFYFVHHSTYLVQKRTLKARN